ncbi:hypothetical protein CTAYLR_002268 [Chrysophaeum taylorii]|uniref:ABC transporter domain-containing protein n=1 Tax=Chrysophaeum taylorii TaxID=2483200 RepID=A0AAD7UPH4_9STRA|nr:hypothetical protein CTAYLR_002268 [Chrysophaeum taylorii]
MDDRLVAACSVLFARIVLRGKNESIRSVWLWVQGALLFGIAVVNVEHGFEEPWGQNFGALAAAEVASFVLGRGCGLVASLGLGGAVGAAVARGYGARVARVATAVATYRVFATRQKVAVAASIAVFASLPRLCAVLLPVDDFLDAFETLESLHGSEESRRGFLRQTVVVAVICTHVQLGVGWAGVEYLRASQIRKNALVDGVANKKLTARQFGRQKTISFVCWVAAPYLLQRVSMGAVYELSFRKFSFGIARALRVDAVLAAPDGERGGGGDFRRSALAVLSAANGPSSDRLTLEAYGSAAEASARRVYELASRKIFALPKLALLPSLVAAHPVVFACSLPVFVVIDVLKARMMVLLSTAIEDAKKKARTATSTRSRVEAHDASRATSIDLVSATTWNTRQWHRLSQEVERHAYVQTALESVRRYVRWLYWADILTPAIEVALAGMLEKDVIRAADLWVISRAMEDSLDTLLTRSLAEADLAALRTDLARLNSLVADMDDFRNSSVPNLACGRGGHQSPFFLEVRDLAYERGTAKARVPWFRAEPGEVIAVTGPNASGKSTWLSLLRSCYGAAPPAALNLVENGAKILVPPTVAVVPQKPYCPLHARPIDWLLYPTDVDLDDASALLAASDLLGRLDFFRANEQRKDVDYSTLLLEHDDYCGSLSGGQAVKLELARQILLPAKLGFSCPALIMLDESFAPLDPISKRKVQQLLRTTCPEAIVLVIYHADVTFDGDPACVPSGDFFTDVVHFQPAALPSNTASLTASTPEGLVLSRVGTCEEDPALRSDPIRPGPAGGKKTPE